MTASSSVTAKVCAVGAWLGLTAALLAAAGFVREDQLERARDRAYWTVTGRPCPQIASSDLAEFPRRLDQTFTFEGRRFWRISGAAACSGLTTTGAQAKHYDVCQFKSPRALAVRAGPGTTFYDVDGGPATLTVGPHDEVTCALNARFKGE